MTSERRSSLSRAFGPKVASISSKSRVDVAPASARKSAASEMLAASIGRGDELGEHFEQPRLSRPLLGRRDRQVGGRVGGVYRVGVGDPERDHARLRVVEHDETADELGERVEQAGDRLVGVDPRARRSRSRSAFFVRP